MYKNISSGVVDVGKHKFPRYHKTHYIVRRHYNNHRQYTRLIYAVFPRHFTLWLAKTKYSCNNYAVLKSHYKISLAPITSRTLKKLYDVRLGNRISLPPGLGSSAYSGRIVQGSFKINHHVVDISTKRRHWHCLLALSAGDLLSGRSGVGNAVQRLTRNFVNREKRLEFISERQTVWVKRLRIKARVRQRISPASVASLGVIASWKIIKNVTWIGSGGRPMLWRIRAPGCSDSSEYIESSSVVNTVP